MAIIPKLNYTFKAIPVRIPVDFFTEIDKLVLKSISSDSPGSPVVKFYATNAGVPVMELGSCMPWGVPKDLKFHMKLQRTLNSQNNSEKER